ncbi:MAG: hypothetical protein ACXWV1_12060, partial [Chitinophagaceae bacterium]
KNVNKSSQVSILAGTSTELTASWQGNYSWSTGATTRSITVSPVVNTTYTVSDGTGCLMDTYDVIITANKLITFQKSNQ